MPANFHRFQAFVKAFEQSVRDFDRLPTSSEPLLLDTQVRREFDVADAIDGHMAAQHTSDDPSVVDTIPMARIGALGGIVGATMRGTRGVRGRQRHAALAARVSNLVDEHGHGLLMQMLQVRVDSLTRGFLSVVISVCAFTHFVQSTITRDCLGQAIRDCGYASKVILFLFVTVNATQVNRFM